MVSRAEYAQLALLVYNAFENEELSNRPLLPDGWEEQDRQVDDDLGFSYGIYKKGNEVVVAYTGTNGNVDWIANGSTALGMSSAQITNAARAYFIARNLNPGATITFTGHSLGGGLASVMATWFDKAATLFDTAPFKATAINPLAILATQAALALEGVSSFSVQ